MAKLNKAQLEAVINTIKKAKENQRNELLKKSQKTIEKSKAYKTLISLLEEEKVLYDKIELLKQNRDKKMGEIYNMINGSIHLYNCTDRFRNDVIDKLIAIESNKLNGDITNDYSAIENEILVASIDPSFNINQFIDKYSK